jgi:hypothetical protein
MPAPHSSLRRSLALLGCVAGLSLAITADTALAQRGGGGFAVRAGSGMGSMSPSVTKAHLKKFAALLELDEVQLTTAEDFLAAFQAEHDVIAKQMRKDSERISQEVQDSQDFSLFREEMPKVMETYRTAAEAQEKQFFSDFRSILTPGQEERWHKVEKLHRRLRSLPAGMLAGESVDLIATVEQLKLAEPSPELAAMLDRYEAELDRALIDRDKLREEQTAGMMRGGEGGGFNFDMEQIRKSMTEMRKAGLSVCEINQRFARSVETTLPEDRRAEFAQQVRIESFPRVYRETHAAKCLKAAAAFNDLSAEQKSTIAEMLETYEREVKSINTRWADAVLASEADGGGDPMSMFMGGGESPAIADARKAKRELDKTTRDKLNALLTEEQLERLPEREDDAPGMGMFRMGG